MSVRFEIAKKAAHLKYNRIHLVLLGSIVVPIIHLFSRFVKFLKVKVVRAIQGHNVKVFKRHLVDGVDSTTVIEKDEDVLLTCIKYDFLGTNNLPPLLYITILSSADLLLWQLALLRSLARVPLLVVNGLFLFEDGLKMFWEGILSNKSSPMMTRYPPYSVYIILLPLLRYSCS